MSSQHLLTHLLNHLDLDAFDDIADKYSNNVTAILATNYMCVQCRCWHGMPVVQFSLASHLLC